MGCRAPRTVRSALGASKMRVLASQMRNYRLRGVGASDYQMLCCSRRAVPDDHTAIREFLKLGSALVALSGCQMRSRAPLSRGHRKDPGQPSSASATHGSPSPVQSIANFSGPNLA
jgi:hypothetical protein